MFVPFIAFLWEASLKAVVQLLFLAIATGCLLTKVIFPLADVIVHVMCRALSMILKSLVYLLGNFPKVTETCTLLLLHFLHRVELLLQVIFNGVRWALRKFKITSQLITSRCCFSSFYSALTNTKFGAKFPKRIFGVLLSNLLTLLRTGQLSSHISSYVNNKCTVILQASKRRFTKKKVPKRCRRLKRTSKRIIQQRHIDNRHVQQFIKGLPDEHGDQNYVQYGQDKGMMNFPEIPNLQVGVIDINKGLLGPNLHTSDDYSRSSFHDQRKDKQMREPRVNRNLKNQVKRHGRLSSDVFADQSAFETRSQGIFTSRIFSSHKDFQSCLKSTSVAHIGVLQHKESSTILGTSLSITQMDIKQMDKCITKSHSIAVINWTVLEDPELYGNRHGKMLKTEKGPHFEEQNQKDTMFAKLCSTTLDNAPIMQSDPSLPLEPPSTQCSIQLIPMDQNNTVLHMDSDEESLHNTTSVSQLDLISVPSTQSVFDLLVQHTSSTHSMADSLLKSMSIDILSSSPLYFDFPLQNTPSEQSLSDSVYGSPQQTFPCQKSVSSSLFEIPKQNVLHTTQSLSQLIPMGSHQNNIVDTQQEMDSFEHSLHNTKSVSQLDLLSLDKPKARPTFESDPVPYITSSASSIKAYHPNPKVTLSAQSVLVSSRDIPQEGITCQQSGSLALFEMPQQNISSSQSLSHLAPMDISREQHQAQMDLLDYSFTSSKSLPQLGLLVPPRDTTTKRQSLSELPLNLSPQNSPSEYSVCQESLMNLPLTGNTIPLYCMPRLSPISASSLGLEDVLDLSQQNIPGIHHKSLNLEHEQLSALNPVLLSCLRNAPQDILTNKATATESLNHQQHNIFNTKLATLNDLPYSNDMISESVSGKTKISNFNPEAEVYELIEQLVCNVPDALKYLGIPLAIGISCTLFNTK